ncbi:MAG: phage head morphogenesis protein [Treponema sp.]|nr:phage head morphogenesis protein [Treponema sp.]
MKSKIPMTKTEWNALEPKLRFRAFTVARLSQLDYIEASRGRLISAMEKGEGYASTWKDIKAIAAEDGAINFIPGYWENVYRTNTQTAYTAGKLTQFKDNPPQAWRLLIIDDNRTSDICRGLMRDGKQSLVMASDHPFWETFGFPPYHFQCRTGLQAVYKSEIGQGTIVENPSMKSLRKQFAPMNGFGGNPLDNGNYWMMTKGMFERGLRYGIINEFNMLDNIVADFDSLWKGYKREIVGKGWIDIHEKAIGRDEFKKNYDMAKKRATDGDHVKILPVHEGKGIKGWKNPDYLINASLWELESPNGSETSINRAIRDGQKQALNLILQIPETVDRAFSIKIIRNRFIRKDSPAKIKNIIVYFGNQKNVWTADQIINGNIK